MTFASLPLTKSINQTVFPVFKLCYFRASSSSDYLEIIRAVVVSCGDMKTFPLERHRAAPNWVSFFNSDRWMYRL